MVRGDEPLNTVSSYGGLDEFITPDSLAGQNFEPLVIRNIKNKGRKMTGSDSSRYLLGSFRAGIDSVIMRHQGKNFGNMTPGTVESEIERSIQQILNFYEQMPIDMEVTTRNVAKDEVRRAIELLTGRSVTFADGKFKGGRSGQRKLPGT